MKILITGACGFIGSNYLNYFFNEHKDFEVVVVDMLTYCSDINYINKFLSNKNFKFIKGDLCDAHFVYELFSHEKFDYVMNFAAESSVDKSNLDPELFYNNNVGIVLNLIKFCVYFDVKRFNQVSTDEVYGSSSGEEFNEDSPLNPSNPYSKSKAMCDEAIISSVHYEGLKATITRSSNNFGINQYEDKLIPLVIKNACMDKKIPIYGDGTNIRDWIYVDDNCRALDLVLFNGKIGEIYNVSGHKLIKNIDLVKLILKKMNKPESLIEFVKDRPNHDYCYSISSNKIEKELGWKVTSNFDEDLDITLDYYLRKFKNNL